MGSEFREKVATYLFRSGDIQYATLNIVRAILALLIVGVACYCEIAQQPASEPFYMLVGLVIGMYFEKGTALLGQSATDPNARAAAAEETFGEDEPEPSS